MGDAILKGHADIAKFSEQELLSMIKQLNVIPVSIVVRRYDFLSSRQDLSEKTKLFAARLKQKATNKQVNDLKYLYVLYKELNNFKI